MKGAYPVIIHREDDGFVVDIPDFNIGTQGDSIVEAIEMARDAIGLMGIDMEDDGGAIPEPYSTDFVYNKDDIFTLVDVDFVEYRKRADNRAIRKNVTIPYWLSVAADKEDINYSKVLREALEKVLGITQNMG